MDGWTHERVIDGLRTERDQLRAEVKKLKEECDVWKEQFERSCDRYQTELDSTKLQLSTLKEFFGVKTRRGTVFPREIEVILRGIAE